MRNIDKQFRRIAALVGILAGLAAIASLYVQLQDSEDKRKVQASEIAEKDRASIAQQTAQALQAGQATSMAEMVELQNTPNTNDPIKASTVTAQVAEIRSTQTAIFESLQNVYATQTAAVAGISTPYPTDTPLPSRLVECDSQLMKGASKQVQPNTFIVGDVYVNERRQFDNGTTEGTVVFFETQGSVRAPYGAGCYTGPYKQLDNIVQQLRNSGCQSGCKTVRVVVVKDDGTQTVEYW